jgi:hypothetical protein
VPAGRSLPRRHSPPTIFHCYFSLAELVVLVTFFRCDHSWYFFVRCASLRALQHPKSSTYSTSPRDHGRQNRLVNHANLFVQLLFSVWQCSLVVAHCLVGILSFCASFEFFCSPFYAKGKSFSVIDIYNGGSGIWTTAQLSSARYDLAATSLPEQDLALFAGGYDGKGACGCPILSLFLLYHSSIQISLPSLTFTMLQPDSGPLLP